jgi:hypothetical protein
MYVLSINRVALAAGVRVHTMRYGHKAQPLRPSIRFLPGPHGQIFGATEQRQVTIGWLYGLRSDGAEREG